jgi:hypothetical protein
VTKGVSGDILTHAIESHSIAPSTDTYFHLFLQLSHQSANGSKVANRRPKGPNNDVESLAMIQHCTDMHVGRNQNIVLKIGPAQNKRRDVAQKGAQSVATASKLNN